MRKPQRRTGELLEQLEDRRLMSSATVDVRLVGGGQSATVTNVGQQIDFELWVNVTGNNADGNDEGLQVIIGSLLSSNISGGSALGNLTLTRSAPFDAIGSNDGTQADLDSDTDLDVGGNDNNDVSPMYAARSGGETTNGTVSGATKSFKVATGTFTVSSLLTGVSTNLTFRPRVGTSSHVIFFDGQVNTGQGGVALQAGKSLVLKRQGTGSISGRVFNDKNANGIFDGSDTGISGFRVFLDEDFDGNLDAGEISKPVSATGTYTFSNVPTGTYRVREVFRSGWRQTFPALGYYEVPLGYGQTGKSLSFANTDTVLIKGRVWMDANKNKVIDSAEPGLSGWSLYLDRNNNGKRDKNEELTTSDSNGNYRFFNLPAGTYRVRIAPLSNYTITTPTSGYHLVTLGAGATVSNKNFGEKKLK
jgi:hypothetical protein